MRKTGFIILLSAICLVSCSKSNDRDCSNVTITASPAEVEALRTYLNDNGIDATEDSRGFFYTINSPGNDNDKPKKCNTVTVKYAGKLTSGVQFDASDNATFLLSTVITGWQEGLPIIGEGGSITLYIPPSLGYGNVDYPDIPANSNLIFDINLLGVY